MMVTTGYAERRSRCVAVARVYFASALLFRLGRPRASVHGLPCKGRRAPLGPRAVRRAVARPHSWVGGRLWVSRAGRLAR